VVKPIRAIAVNAPRVLVFIVLSLQMGSLP
jgi:hypothetical protein